MSEDLFFVYGTLKEGGKLAGPYNRYRESSVQAKLKGFDLFNLGWFPGIKKGEGVVVGELHRYRESDAVTAMFDRVEGYDPNYEKYSLFLRRKVIVEDTDGNEYEAIAYLFNQDTPKDAKKIEDGNWPI
jgi:gamma-glutamylcyclotransferase (GGCT)/AIG2-like uncharacterized protein YtfP